MISDKHCVQG